MKNLFSLLSISLLCTFAFSGYAVQAKQPQQAVAKRASANQEQTEKNPIDSVREFRILLLTEVKNQKNPLIVLNLDEFFMGDMRALPAEMLEMLKDFQGKFQTLSQEEQLETMMKIAAQVIPYQVFVDERIPGIFTEAFEKGARIIALTCHASSSSEALLSALKKYDFSFAASSPIEDDLIVTSDDLSYLYKEGILFAGHPELLKHALVTLFKSTDLSSEYSVIMLGSVQSLFE